MSAHASCGSAFCTVNSDCTSETAIVEPGGTLDLRYEYINQDQPRTGTLNAGVGEIPAHHNEVSTANRNLLLSYSYTFDSNWGISTRSSARTFIGRQRRAAYGAARVRRGHQRQVLSAESGSGSGGG